MICPQCRAEIRDDAKFCGSCGMSIPPAAPRPPAAPPAAEPRRQAPPPPVSPPPSPPPGSGAFHFDSDGRGQGRGYTWSIEHQGAFALAVIHLQPEQSISAEAGAMVSMSANV